MSDLVSPCDSVEPLLGDYADGEIVSAADKARIEAHLKECPSCTSDLAFFRATNFVISSRFPDVQPPIDVFLRTAQATYARPTLRARLAGWLAPAPVRIGLGGAFAAAVVLAVVVPLTQRQSGDGVRPLAQNDQAKIPAGDSLKPASRPTDHSSRLVAEVAPKPTVTAPVVEGTPAADVALPRVDIAANEPAHLAARRPNATHAPVRVLPQLAVSVTPSVTPAPERDLSTVVQKIKATRIVIPVRRDLDPLARRGGMAERTLPDGELPREFVAPKLTAPKLTAPIAIAESPAHDAAAVVSPAAVESGSEPSSARSVIEPPAHTHSALHINLGGAGGRVAFAAIPGVSAPKASDDSWLPGKVDAPTN